MLKTNERAFTIVELLTSFTLATVVMIFLFNILLTVKKDYMIKKLESDFSVQYSLLSDALNKDAINCPISQITKNNNTYSITFLGGGNCPQAKSELVIGDRQVTYRGEVYKFPEGVKINQNNVVMKKESNNFSYYYINIPISIDYSITGDTKEVSLTSFYFLSF